MSDKKSSDSPTPDELGAMRFAYKVMREEYPNRYTSETDKRDLARSVIRALGRPNYRNDEETILNVMNV